MKRKIIKTLLEWKNQNTHLPLIIRGARQVGKSYVIETFGLSEFKVFAQVNFERSPEFKSCFLQNDPKKIIEQLELLLKQSIIPGKTLLFLDEIQECPEALVALRYFKEECPDLHVIAAGSLLDFVLNETGFSMPVGRVQFLYLKPLSFEEFLWAMDEEALAEYISGFSLNETFPEAIHQKLLELIRLYLKLGGMPAVIQTYLNTKGLEEAMRMQVSLLQTYRADFSKYGKRAELRHLETLFAKVPRVATQQLKYSKIDEEVQSRELKAALGKLVSAGLVYQVFHTSASGLPLSATVNERKFKTLFVDVGLMLCATGFIPTQLVTEDILFLLQGAMMEQFVGQELLAYQDPYHTPELFYWSREEKSSQAEVDYVMNLGGVILPIEVKSKSLGYLKSLKRFMEEKNSKLGVRISEHPFSLAENIVSIPLYAVFTLNQHLTIPVSTANPSKSKPQ